MAELRAGRSWRWFHVRLSGLSPDAAFWRQWRHHQQHGAGAGAAGSPPAKRGQPVEPTYVVDAGDDAAWAAFVKRAGWKHAAAPAEGVTGDAAGR